MKKKIAFLEIVMLISAVISFSYLISERDLRIVSAQSEVVSGCCTETKENTICQEIPFFQKGLCKDNFYPTSCDAIEGCKIGCCYSPSTGVCAMNSPKQKCLENGGEWKDSPTCDIPQCRLGCCVLGNQVSLTNSRECTLLSNRYNFEKKFIPLGQGESCEKYVGLEELGACLSNSNDFSGEKNCIFTSKKNCRTGDFKPGYLCTSKELNTVCKPTKKTTCVEDKDQVYFVDSCGNIANVYDASKADDQSYWEKPILPENSCSPESPSCGNCDYLRGSICARYQQGKTLKPTFGDYVCKNLNCGERRHGESWCVYDTNPLEIPYPVGSRHFIARCYEGKISIEGCADFMQEVCTQIKDESSGFTAAKCLVNDWRSCIYANDASSYEEVKRKCDENPQCIMLDEAYGQDKFKRSDQNFLAGFNPNLLRDEHGMVIGQSGEVGRGQNKNIVWCIPRFTPGFQFWSPENYKKSSKEEPLSSYDYGGNRIETNILCSLADFICVSRKWRECTLFGGCDDWQDDDRNWECNYNGAHSSIKTEDLPKLMKAMNDRCRSIGSCGVSTSVFNGTPRDLFGFSVKRIKVDRKGKVQENYDASAYKLPLEYLSSITRSTKNIKNLEELKSLSSTVLSTSDVDSSTMHGELSSGYLDLRKLLQQASEREGEEGFLAQFSSFAGPILGTGVGLVSLMAGKKVVAAEAASATPPTHQVITTLKAAGITIAFTLLGAWLGGMIGKMLVDKDWSPGKQAKFMEFMAAVGGLLGLVVGAGVVSVLSGGTFFGGIAAFAEGASVMGVFGPIGLAIAIAYIIFVGFFDEYIEEEYYIMQYNCESWMPPRNGNCSLCNNDVRPCSEYRCRSIGSNCRYMVGMGEPGYCTSINDVWQAKITPWKEILTEGNSYVDIRDNSFRIVGQKGGEVEPWQDLTFGIITNKPAICRIDYEHTKTFEEMKFTMTPKIDEDLGKIEGLHHQITLSPFVRDKTASKNTLGLSVGEENEYYIRCMNFAGQTNDAEFVVRIKVKESYDLTPAELKRFDPPTNSYLRKGANSTSVMLYLNEPAECRFIKDYDVVGGESGFNEMPNNMTCFTSPESVFLGEWLCGAILENLTEGQNKFYFRCKDKPHLTEETEFDKRNVNLHSKEYVLNVCKDGLDIKLLNSKTLIEEKNFTLSVSTSGCLGKAVCSYRIENLSSSFVKFFETGGTTHNQPMTLPQGSYSIDVKCEDEAKNTNITTFNFEVFFDSEPPIITRIIYDKGKITLKTNEDAECFSSLNYSALCEIKLKDNQNLSKINYLSKTHSFTANPYETYYIKCRDKKLNEPNLCSITITPFLLTKK